MNMEFTKEEIQMLMDGFKVDEDLLLEAFEHGEIEVYENVIDAGQDMLLDGHSWHLQGHAALEEMNRYTMEKLPGRADETILERLMYTYGMVKLPNGRFARWNS